MKYLCFLASALSGVAMPALAQSASMQGSDPALSESSGLPEIVVTAQKRSERANDVPLAISVLSSDQLATRGVTDPVQLERVVPGFTVQKTNLGEPVFFVRGVGYSDPSMSINPTVSVYADEAPLPFSVMAKGAALDLERVEVLKGPQGTLFGQNSTGGLVNYIAAKPGDTLDAGIDLNVGRFNQVDATAFVSGPLADNLSARLAVQNEYRGDWQRSITRPGDARGERRFINARASIAHELDGVRFLLTGQVWQDRSDTQAPQFVLAAPTIPVSPPADPVVLAALLAQQPAPDNLRLADWDAGSPTKRNDKFHQVGLRGEFDLSDAVSLTSLTSYTDLKSYSPFDHDGTAYHNAFFDVNARLKTFSQELRLAGSIDALHWLIGANYGHQNTQESNAIDYNSTNGNPLGLPIAIRSNRLIDNQRVDTYAAFGSLEYKITDTVTARGSLRYTKENRDYNGCMADSGDGTLAATFAVLSTIFSGSPTTIAPGTCITFDNATFKPLPIVRDSLNEDNVSWRAGVDWKPQPAMLIYATVAKGYKSGGFTVIPAVFAAQTNPITQESVLAYETGAKLSLFDRRAQLNVAAYYYDYRDKQLQGYANIFPFGNLPKLVNIPKASVKGVEFDLSAKITDHLRVQLAGNYLDTKIKTDPANPVCPITAPGLPCSFVGEHFPNAAKYQLTGDIEQRFPIGDGKDAYVGMSALYHSSTISTFGSRQSPAARAAFFIPAYTLLDVRAGLSFNDGHWLAELWGRNITNKFYLTGASRSFEEITRFTGMPAAYGIRLQWRL